VEIGPDGKRHDHTPMPPAGLITSIQVGLIDKGEAKPSRAKRKRKILHVPYRCKACIEVWTVPVADILRQKSKTCWRRFTQLRQRDSFEATLKGMVQKGHVSEEFKEWALDQMYAGPLNTGLNDLYGVPHDNNNGWHYYDEHLVRVRMDSEDPAVDLFLNRETVISLELATDYAGHMFPDGARQTHVGREDLVRLPRTLFGGRVCGIA